MLKKYLFVLMCVSMLLVATVSPVSAEKRIDHIELVVFDFDKTITSKHSINAKEGDVLITTEGQRAFRALVEYLVGKGKKVAVASYGKKATILREMGKIFREEEGLFNERNVITPLDVHERWEEECFPPEDLGINKNNMLQILKTRFDIVDNCKIALIDDDARNIQNATQDGYIGTRVPPCLGMDRLLWMIRMWLEGV